MVETLLVKTVCYREIVFKNYFNTPAGTNLHAHTIMSVGDYIPLTCILILLSRIIIIIQLIIMHSESTGYYRMLRTFLSL